MSASATFDSDPTDPSAPAPITAASALTAATPAPVPSTTSAVATSVSPNPSLRIQRIADTPSEFLLTIDQPDTHTLPVFFIDVLDISGSMGCPASDNTTSDAAAFTRADLVRHSVATQIELLRPQDSLAVVLFDQNSQIALPPTRDRAAARSILPRIAPNGGTNIWGGLFKALQIAEEQATSVSGLKGAPQNVVILLQTDGESDATYNPPRGIVPTLMAWLDAHPTVRLTIHTIGYGMGDGLDTPLLRSIADSTGGTYSYIPDGGMVGTVFIHLMANLMSIVHPDLILQIPEAGYAQKVGPLQSGQVKELVVSLPGATSFSATLRSPTQTLATAAFSATDDDAIVPAGFPSAVHATLRELYLALASPVLPNPLSDLMATIHAILPTDPSHRMMSLLTDLADSDPSRGQIGKAFASAAAFRRWGRHYIPTVISSLQNGWAINFKDTLSTEVFGTLLTHDLVSRGDAIFMAIPPPTPSPSSSTSSYSYGAATGHRTPVSMASIHSSAGPCFLPGSLVRMVDGTEKRCDQIQPGDHDIAGYRIQCVIKTLVSTANIVRLSGPHRPANAVPIPDDAGFTLWHPVLPEGGEWSHPATIGNAVELVETDAIYNFVLAPSAPGEERPGMLIVNGIKTCTMGHNFRANAVIDHPYFGARRLGVRNILNDLEQQPGWEHGYITWSNLQVEHDPATGMITGMFPAAPVPPAV